jgi:hypothetical protein
VRYEITGRGGKHPTGCIFHASTAVLALERYRAVLEACGNARIYGKDGRPMTPEELTRLAEMEARGGGA